MPQVTYKEKPMIFQHKMDKLPDVSKKYSRTRIFEQTMIQTRQIDCMAAESNAKKPNNELIKILN